MTAMDAGDSDVLKAWDAGDPVWSCDLGGMGPGYEQCIQMMGFEMWRAMRENPMDWDAYEEMDDDEQSSTWKTYKETIENTDAVREVISKLGPSGAQYGAAFNIASVFARNGYAEGMKIVPEHRRIQVSRNFPQV